MGFPLITSSGTGTNPLDMIGLFSSGPLLGVATISFNRTVSLHGYSISSAGTDLNTLLWPILTDIDPANVTGGVALFTINGNSALEVMSLPLLGKSYPPLTITNNGTLTSLDIPLWKPINGQVLDFGTNALDQTSVDNVLARCVANGSFTSISVNLAGGSNAHPSAAGMASAGTLVARGVAVWIN